MKIKYILPALYVCVLLYFFFVRSEYYKIDW